MEKQTFNQVNEQTSSAYINGSDALPTVLIERSDKSITVGNLEPGTNNVLFTEGGVDKYHPNVSPERLSDEHQAALAERLAGKPLKSEMGSAAVSAAAFAPTPAFIDRIPEHIMNQPQAERAAEAQPTPQEKEAALSREIEALLQNLSSDDKDKLFRYSTYKSDKANAQSDNDGHASELAGQYMGQEYRAMSADAQRIADQYHSMLSQLSRLRRQS